jgi:hypothetical protein
MNMNPLHLDIRKLLVIGEGIIAGNAGSGNEKISGVVF